MVPHTISVQSQVFGEVTIEGCLYQFFLVAVIKYHDRGNVEKEGFILAYDDGGIESMSGNHSSKRQARQQEWGAESHIFKWREKGELARRDARLLISKPAPTDTLPPAKRHPPPQRVPPKSGDQCSST